MVTWIIDVVRLLIVLTGRHRALALENLALRQQLALYRRIRSSAGTEQREPCAMGNKEKFYPYGTTRAQVFAEQD